MRLTLLTPIKYYLSREWVRLGHKVTIVASSYSHIRTPNITMPDSQDYVHENIDGIDYIWCKTSFYPENGIKRVINIFAFLNKVSWRRNMQGTTYKVFERGKC